MTDSDNLANRFTYHPANTDARREAHQLIRETCHNTAYLISQCVPDGRERALAITKIEECMFWANAAIAREPS